MKILFGTITRIIKLNIPFFAKIFGIKILNKKDTIEHLMKWNLSYSNGETIVMKKAITWGNAPTDFEKDLTVSNNNIGVFLIPKGRKVKIFKYGGISLDNNVLDLDYHAMLYLKTLVEGDKRETIQIENCILVWSHYWGGGYYDFLFYIYSKALRIISLLNSSQLCNIKIAYPIFNKTYENELWKLAGLGDDQIIDTRKYKISAENYLVGNNTDWYYPHREDITRLRQILFKVDIGKFEYKFVFISRKGTRMLTNEDEIINVLKPLNFIILKDKPRSVASQIAIFNNAKIIIGPHGAAFSNVLWCNPNTHLIELFPKNYYPPHYRYLAEILGLKYSAIFENNVGKDHFSHSKNNFHIEPRRIKMAVEEIILDLGSK